MKLGVQVEKVEFDRRPIGGGRACIRLLLVGIVNEAEAKRIVECWKKKETCVVEEILTDSGHTLTIDFRKSGEVKP